MSKDVSGGAQKETVEVTRNSPPHDDDDDLVHIVTTAPGTFGSGGVVKVGTEELVPIRSYSSAWMRPSTKEAAKTIEAEMERRRT